MRPLLFSVLAVCALSLGAYANSGDDVDAASAIADASEEGGGPECAAGEAPEADETGPTETAPPETTPTEPAAPVEEAKVCCESFGYGAGRVKCCQTYKWTTTAECAVRPGFVGGGKTVVGDELCPTAE